MLLFGVTLLIYVKFGSITYLNSFVGTNALNL